MRDLPMPTFPIADLSAPGQRPTRRQPLRRDPRALGRARRVHASIDEGYLRRGAKMLGAPAWDPDFNTADLPLLRIEDLPSRYRKHFLAGR